MKYITGDGDLLSDLVATISELRYRLTFAAPSAVVVLECPSWVDVVEKVGHERVEALYWAFADHF